MSEMGGYLRKSLAKTTTSASRQYTDFGRTGLGAENSGALADRPGYLKETTKLIRSYGLLNEES